MSIESIAITDQKFESFCVKLTKFLTNLPLNLMRAFTIYDLNIITGKYQYSFLIYCNSEQNCSNLLKNNRIKRYLKA